nr:helix-turn-helix transcriptional regulator [uncultured Arsenicibacter sp.]
MSEISSEISQLIKKARKAEGLTQKELAAKMGVVESAVNKLESGERHPTVATLENVAKALNKKLRISFE